jgi:hypothetical protein
MEFADLKPGDEITVLQGKNSKYICRAKVIKHCEDHIDVVLWNPAGQRWNRNRIGSSRSESRSIPGRSEKSPAGEGGAESSAGRGEEARPGCEL